MHIRRFEAATIEAALARVKAELGPDALILSSRTLRPARGLWGLMSRSRVEVQAALERTSGGSGRPPEGVPDRLGEAKAALESDRVSPGADLERLLVELRGELSALRRSRDLEEEIRNELQDLHRAIANGAPRQNEDVLDPTAARLARAGLERGHLRRLLADWREERSAGGDASLEALLRRRIEAALSPPRPSETPSVRVLVGAPGVGKTTTLAKLAARNEEGEGEIALLSMDSYRIGAQDQLRRYAALLDSPFCEVGSAAELPSVVARHPGRRILVDTAGAGRRVEERLGALADLRSRVGRPLSIDVVIDATTRFEVQRAQLQRFAAFAPDRVILTRLDECDRPAAALNLLLTPGCPPLSWLANGQRVPEDLLVAEPDHFLRGAMGVAA